METVNTVTLMQA